MKVKSFEEAQRLLDRNLEGVYSTSSGNVAVVLRRTTNPLLSHTGGDYTKKIIFSPRGWMYTTSWDLGCCPRCGQYLAGGTRCDICNIYRGEWQPYPSPEILEGEV